MKRYPSILSGEYNLHVSGKYVNVRRLKYVNNRDYYIMSLKEAAQIWVLVTPLERFFFKSQFILQSVVIQLERMKLLWVDFLLKDRVGDQEGKEIHP
jgi:hypothetical protein